jgi:hypothetical protein
MLKMEKIKVFERSEPKLGCWYGVRMEVGWA